MVGVTFLPIWPWPILAVLAAAMLALIWWPAPEGVPEEPVTRRLMRVGMVAVLFLAALRPGVPGQFVNASATNLNVYFVVDTTSSMIAEDYGGSYPRLAGVKDDIHALATEFAGARMALITFDRRVGVRVPSTTDGLAFDAAVNTLMPEPNEYSVGSSVTAPGPALAAMLKSSARTHPDRGRIVFYFGDGEQTARAEPEPMGVDGALVQGGAVLGYGTSEGGPMRDTRSRFVGGEPTYITDPGTGRQARSVIDETRLADIGRQLGLAYVHREAGDDLERVLAGVDRGKFGTSEEVEEAKVRGRTELYWWLVIALLPMAAVEAAHALRGYRGLRPGGGYASGS